MVWNHPLIRELSLPSKGLGVGNRISRGTITVRFEPLTLALRMLLAMAPVFGSCGIPGEYTSKLGCRCSTGRCVGCRTGDGGEGLGCVSGVDSCC